MALATQETTFGEAPGTTKGLEMEEQPRTHPRLLRSERTGLKGIIRSDKKERELDAYNECDHENLKACVGRIIMFVLRAQTYLAGPQARSYLPW